MASGMKRWDNVRRQPRFRSPYSVGASARQTWVGVHHAHTSGVLGWSTGERQVTYGPGGKTRTSEAISVPRQRLHLPRDVDEFGAGEA